MSVRLLHYSDVENAYDDPERIGKLAGTIEHLRDDDVIICGTGDNTAPGVLSLVTKGRQALDFFRAIDPAVETFGNHDFDYGITNTRDLVSDAPQTWVSSNVHYEGDRFGESVGVVPTTVVERNGTRVGFFGVLDDATPALNPEAGDLDLTDPYREAAKAVEKLREQDVDYVVALSHLGRGDEELAFEVDVDVILGGHIHSERVERVNDTLLTRPGANGKVLFEVTLGNESESEAGGEDESPRAIRHTVDEGPTDEGVADTLRRRMADAGLDEIVATVDEPIERTEATVFRGESRIGNFVTDAYRWAAGTDIGFQNSGGIREGPPLQGDVTVKDLISVVPFDEPVAVAELTGAELLELFSQASGKTLGFGEEDWWHAHVSGATIEWDAREEHVINATVGGDPIDPEQTYTLATSSYLFYSDHEFPLLAESRKVRSLGVQHELLIDYAREHGIDPQLEGRIVRHGHDEQV